MGRGRHLEAYLAGRQTSDNAKSPFSQAADVSWLDAATAALSGSASG